MSIKKRIKSTKWGKVIFNSYFYVKIRDIRKIKDTIRKYKKAENSTLIRDMINEYRLNNIPYDEYFLFKFDEISDISKRYSFVSDYERIEVSNRLNLLENDPVFYDKEITYQTFQQFYLRDVLRINKECKFEKFDEFINNHPIFICKPIDGGCGTGIRIIDSNNSSREELFLTLIKDYSGKGFAEELLEQVAELKELHPKSLNTIRMPTIRFDDRVELIHPFLRVGQGNSITDNAGTGGIICALDEKTGVVIAAADEFGNTYTHHPDSLKPLIGFKIPKWEEAEELVKELALVVPSNRYCSWDLALTPKGWALVEVNAKGQFVWQYATLVGFRDELDSILKEILLEK